MDRNVSRETLTRRPTLGIIALIFALAIVALIYALASNRQKNAGPILPEKEWWKQYGGPPRPHGSSHHRRY